LAVVILSFASKKDSQHGWRAKDWGADFPAIYISNRISVYNVNKSVICQKNSMTINCISAMSVLSSLDRCLFVDLIDLIIMSREDTILRGNHLDKVICQVTFNPVLSIDNGVGAFQEKIRVDYPLASVMVEPTLPVINAPVVNNYSFETEDHQWKVNLTRAFISLTSTAYSCWDDFRSRMIVLIEAVHEIFGVDIFNRVGLRYINAIRISKLKENEKETWSTFLQESTLGMFGVEPEHIDNYSSTIEYGYGDHKLRSMTGQIQFRDNNEKGFLIDNDVYGEGTHAYGDILELLDKYNRESFEMLKRMLKETAIERMSQ